MMVLGTVKQYLRIQGGFCNSKANFIYIVSGNHPLHKMVSGTVRQPFIQGGFKNREATFIRSGFRTVKQMMVSGKVKQTLYKVVSGTVRQPTVYTSRFQ